MVTVLHILTFFIQILCNFNVLEKFIRGWVRIRENSAHIFADIDTKQ